MENTENTKKYEIVRRKSERSPAKIKAVLNGFLDGVVTEPGLSENTRSYIQVLRTKLSQQLEDEFIELYGGNITGGLMIMEPPFNFNTLKEIVIQDDTIFACVQAIIVNAYGFGYRLQYKGKKGKENSRKALEEHGNLSDFLDNVNGEESITDILRKAGLDKKIFGNSFYELSLDKEGNIETIYHVPAIGMRLTRLMEVPQISGSVIRNGKSYPTKRKFRLFVQMIDNKKVYFKEFGDPRNFNKDTGEEIKDLNPDPAIVANAMIHDYSYYPGTPYGVPEYISQLPVILGSKEAAWMNYDFFVNNAIPALLVMVNGGFLTKDSLEAIDEAFSGKKGLEAANRTVVLEATGDDMAAAADGRISPPAINVKSLVDERQKDALFKEYTDTAHNQKRAAFRLAPLILGLSSDYNYACYDAKTECLTTTGWVPFEDFNKMEFMKEKHKVLTFDPETGLLEYMYPDSTLVNYSIDSDLVYFCGENLDIAVTRNHRMLFYMEKDLSAPVYMTAEELYGFLLTHDVVYFLRPNLFSLESDCSFIPVKSSNANIYSYRGNVYCFSVPTHYFVTRRNGIETIQGNTANTSFQVADSQVFAPERVITDNIVNRRILKQFDTKYWAYRTASPRVSGNSDMVDALKTLDNMGALTPNIAIHFTNEMFGMDIPQITEDWGDHPFSMVLELAKTGTLKGVESILKVAEIVGGESGGVDTSANPPEDSVDDEDTPEAEATEPVEDDND